MTGDDIGREIDAARREYDKTLALHERARARLLAAVLAGWRAEWQPDALQRRSKLNASYIRRLAREAGLPPAKGGRRPLTDGGHRGKA